MGVSLRDSRQPVKRRLRLVSLSAGIALSCGSPAVTTSLERRSPTQVPVFSVDPTWPKPLPNHWVIGNVVGLSVDTHDHVWILHRPATVTDFERAADFSPPRGACCRAAPPVLELDEVGNVVQSWGGEGEGYEWPQSDPKPASTPYMSRNPVGEHTLFIDHKDNVWLGSNGETGTHVLKFTKSGKFLMQIGRRGHSGGSSDTRNLHGPAGIHVDPETNEVFVADGYGNRRVIVFDGDTGEYKRHWGAYGKPPDDTVKLAYVPYGAPAPQFSTVHCVRVSRDGFVYVCDRGNNRIQVFRKDGTFLEEAFVAPETIPPPGVVNDLAFSPDTEQQYLYVVDGDNEKVWVLRRTNLEILGSFGQGGHFVGGFTLAHNIAVDSKGSIYVGESLEGKRVQRFIRRK